MKTKFLAHLIIIFLFSIKAFTQATINNYKYVIVPDKFDFLKEKDQYQLNSLTEFLFNKYGFTAITEGSDYPNDLKFNRCLALNSNVIKESGVFKTKLIVELKDCNSQVVYTSEVGESREKEYHKAYQAAIRNAFESFQTLNYKYEALPNNVVNIQDLNLKSQQVVNNEIEQLKDEIESLKKEKDKVESKIIEPIIKSKSQEAEKKHKLETQTTIQNSTSTNVLYAQTIDNGFQLVDSTPKVVYKIKKTGLTGVFLVEDKNAIIYKKGDNYILEFYQNNALQQEVLQIKF